MGTNGIRLLAHWPLLLIFLCAGCQRTPDNKSDQAGQGSSNSAVARVANESDNAAAQAAAAAAAACDGPAPPEPKECIGPCYSFESGRQWATEQGIGDPADCEGATIDFVEGCKAYAVELNPAQVVAAQAMEASKRIVGC